MFLSLSTLFRRPRQHLLGAIALFALFLPLGFSAQNSSSFETLHSWVLSAAHPSSPLLRGADGRLYGTASSGGSSNLGAVYALAADGSGYTVLHSFDGNGANPRAGLIQGSDGRLYGTTYQSGSSNQGTVYALAADGSGYTVLHSFDGANGANPQAGLVQGADGRLYGTTYRGGNLSLCGTLPGMSSSCGTVYALAADGSGFTVLHSFGGADGWNPYAELLQGADGRLYGTTSSGGNQGDGTVYALAADGSGYTVLHSFDGNGAYPKAGLIQGADGRLYGTASRGSSLSLCGTSSGIPSGCGIVYALAADGSGYTVLHNFDYANGAYPEAGLIQGADGRLYGTTPAGGSSTNQGTVYALAADGSGYTVLPSFDGNGAYPQAGLIQGTDGRLYGTTYSGGSSDYGTVYALAADGSGYTVLHSFDSGSFTNPKGLLQGADGRLYGTTQTGGSSGVGAVYALAADGGGYTVLHSFDGNGAYPQAGLIQGTDGRLYGTTSGGGSDYGTVYALAADGSGYTVLHSFDGNGAFPQAGLIQGADGRLYGTTTNGGNSSQGAVYALAVDGSGYTVLHSFDNANGAYPEAGLIQGADGRLYGTTYNGGSSNCDIFGCGTVYSLAADGNGYTVLHNFDLADGAQPYAGLIQGADGRLYGTASQGGSSNLGTVYALATDGSGYTVLQNFDGANGATPYAGLIQGLDGYLYGTASNRGPQGGGTLFRLAPPAPTATPTPTPTATPSPTATPTPVHPVELKVTKAGQGTVNSLPGGIECGEVCSAPFEIHSAVTLTAVPELGFGFVRWSGACQGDAPSCTVELNKTKTVKAKFKRTLAELTVTKTGQGEGTVSSTPAGIDCGTECDALFETGTVVALAAVPAEGYEFRGWAGACGGKKPTCAVTLKKAEFKKLTAKFARKRN